MVSLLSKVRASAAINDVPPREERFNAEQNALTAAGAEAYYRAMISGGGESWNVRDQHMVATLDRLVAHHGDEAKAIVWEHNTHVGDARWTDMKRAGMVNVGQLVRERHSDEGVVLVGSGGYTGNVIASDRWGGPTQAVELPPARQGSIEELIHTAIEGRPSTLFIFDGQPPAWATSSRADRAVGVVYDPRAERWGNYVPTVLARRYDAFLWFNETRALEPLHGVHADITEMETWPTGE